MNATAQRKPTVDIVPTTKEAIIEADSPSEPLSLIVPNAFMSVGGQFSHLRYRNPHALGPTPPRKWTAHRLLTYAIKKRMPDAILQRCAAGGMTRRELMPCSGRKRRNK